MTDFDLTTEYRLLLESTKSWLSGDEQTSLSVDAQPDWNLLLDLASWHQLDGFLSLHIETHLAQQVAPREIRSELAKRAAENKVRFIAFIEPALRYVLEALNAQKIPVVALKGAALSRTVFDNLTLRPVGDLDLLISEINLERARQVILDLGYRQRPSVTGTPPSPFDYHFCPRLLSPDGSVDIELHRHLVRADSPANFDIGPLWRRRRTEVLAGQPAGVLHPADLLMHLCLAFFQDRRRRDKSFGSLRQLVDIAASYAHHADELEDFHSREILSNSPSAGPIYCALWAAHHLVGCPISESELERLRPSVYRQQDLEALVRRKIMDREFWAFNNLVTPRDNHHLNVCKAFLGRIAPSRSYLRREFPDLPSGATRELYKRHFSDLAHAATNLIGDPGAFWEELRVDMWMNSLQTYSD